MSFVSLNTIHIVLSEFEKTIYNYHFVKYTINENSYLILIEDSLVLYIEIELNKIKCNNPNVIENNLFLNNFHFGDEYASVNIMELTYNEINYKFNNTKFSDGIYEKFGFKLLRDCSNMMSCFTYYSYLKVKDNDYKKIIDEIAKKLPKIKLRERINNWEGLDYNFIVFEYISGSEKSYAVAYTLQNPISFVISHCNDYIKSGSFKSEMRTESNFTSLFNGYKTKGIKQIRLEDGLNFFTIKKRFKNKNRIWKYADKILSELKTGNLYPEIERMQYKKPTYRWTSEEQVLNICQKLYGKNNIIYQHRPYFLRSSFGGQMSYDVYIIDKAIAIEYQGKQHFEPIDYFGGIENFNKTVIRDKEKKKISKINNIKLVYIYYYEEITPELIMNKIEG